MVIGDQVWDPLVRICAQEAVVTLEASAKRPLRERPGVTALTGRGQMPFSDGERAVARVGQNPLESGCAFGQACRVPRSRGCCIGDRPHSDRMMVAPGQQGSSAGRADRRHMEPVVTQALVGQGIDRRCLDL